MSFLYGLLGKLLEMGIDILWRRWRKNQEQISRDEKQDEKAKAAVEAVRNAKTEEDRDRADSDLLSGGR